MARSSIEGNGPSDNNSGKKKHSDGSRTSSPTVKLQQQQENSNRLGLVSIAAPSRKLLSHLIDAKHILNSLGVGTQISIVAAHWAPKKTLRYIAELDASGVDVVIAGADGSAHLPGMIASLTTIPVIGVPLEGTSLYAMDSLLSIVQMPRGVPVATMAINSGYNAGIYACQILSLKYPQLRQRLVEHKEMLEEQVEADDVEFNGTAKSKNDNSVRADDRMS